MIKIFIVNKHLRYSKVTLSQDQVFAIGKTPLHVVSAR